MSTPNQDPLMPFILKVEDIGTFTFAPRTLGNQIKIECEYCRLTEGMLGVTTFLSNLAQYVADLSILVVSGPPGWSNRQEILAKDACDPETFAKIEKVWSALSDKEAEFRGFLQAKKGGEGEQPDAGAVVAPPVQPAAD